MQVYNYSTHMTSASCTYHNDVDFKFKGNTSNNQQGINIFMHNCMLSARDVAMNNYSALVLSNNLSLDDVFELRSLQKNPGSIINTQLGLSIDAEKNDATKYLYFDSQRETFTFDFNAATSHRLLPLNEMPHSEQSFFNFEMLDEKYARICYKYQHEKFYLAINSNEDVVFAAGYTNYDDLNFNYIDETIFEYIFDGSGESLFLRKPLSGNRTMFLGVSSFDSNKLQLLSAFNASNYLLFNNFNFLVRSNALQLENKLNASWASYTTDDVNKLNINDETLLENLPSNLLVASQYADATPLQVPARPIVLKNQATQLGALDKASYINQRNDNAGPINRDYTNIFAGNSQEKGDENIAINFTMFSNDFVAKADAYSSFKTSASLFPYEQLNVNDACLRTDGAYAGDSPYTSDQILALKNAAQGADGQYLCTWLSAGPDSASAEWVDRYYNTNKMSPMDAAKAVNATYGTYEDFVSAYLQQQSYAYDYFDKKSDVVFEPNQEYFYYRIGNKRINAQLATHDDTLIIDSLQWKTSNNQVFSDAYNANKVYQLDGNSYDVVQNYEAINSNYAFTISFWLKCEDWTKLNAYQILGNLTNTGFALIKDPMVTPLIMVQSTSAINIYNSDFKQVTQTLLPEPTLFVPRFDAIDDFGAISNSAVYKMYADGTLYDKYTFTEAGALTNNWIDVIQNNDSVYMLHSDETTVSHFNFITETLSTFEVTPGSKSILHGDRGIIGTIGTKALPYGANTSLYLYNDNQIVNYDYAANDQFVAFKSLSSASTINFIRDFDVDKDQNIYILNGDYKVAKYNSERVLQYNISTLSALSCINFAISNCYEYIGNDFIHSTIIASRDANDFIHLTKLDEQGNIITTAATDIKYSADATLNLTNAAYLQQKYQNRGNKLDFVVKLVNKYNNRDIKTVVATVDLDEILPGTKHFALRLDGVQGNATIIIDGKTVDTVNFGAAKYAVQQPLISNSIAFGATQFVNGATLAQFLKQPAAYFASNATLLYPKIYAEALSDNDVRFITMQDYTISDLTFHLPCGMRNNIDIIKRMFAFGAPGMKSNNVSIIIKNSGITNDSLKQSLKQQVLSQVSQSMPATINILGVEFVDYE